MLTLYTILLTVHILALVVWLGGGVMLQILARRARKDRENPEHLAMTVRDIAFVAPRTFAPASLVLVITGLWLVLDRNLDFSLWVAIGLVGWGLTFITGNFFLGPAAKKAMTSLATKGAGDAETLSFIDRLLAVARIDLVVLALVVLDMVIKPT